MNNLIVAVILLTLTSTAQAKAYFELGIEGGGVPIVETGAGDINPGGGFKFAIGVQKEVGESGDSLSIALGYLFDEAGEVVYFYVQGLGAVQELAVIFHPLVASVVANDQSSSGLAQAT